MKRSAGGADDVHALLRALAAYSHTSADFPKREGCKCLEENKDNRSPSPMEGRSVGLYCIDCVVSRTPADTSCDCPSL